MSGGMNGMVMILRCGRYTLVCDNFDGCEVTINLKWRLSLDWSEIRVWESRKVDKLRRKK